MAKYEMKLTGVGGTLAETTYAQNVQFFVERLDFMGEKGASGRGLVRMGDGPWILVDGETSREGSKYKELRLLQKDRQFPTAEAMDQAQYEVSGGTLLDTFIDAIDAWGAREAQERGIPWEPQDGFYMEWKIKDGVAVLEMD